MTSRPWRQIATGAAIGLAVAVVYLDVTPSQWTATTTVFVSTTNVDHEATRVTSPTVTGRVASQGMPIPADRLPDHVAVSVPADTSLLRIAFTADDPHTATTGANAYADAYQHDGDVVAASSLKLKADLVALQHRIDATRTALGTASVRRAVLLRAQISALHDQIRLTRQNGPVPSAVVVDPATVPTSPSGPNRQLVLVGGLLFGLFLGRLMAWRGTLLGPPGLAHLPST